MTTPSNCCVLRRVSSSFDRAEKESAFDPQLGWETSYRAAGSASAVDAPCTVLDWSVFGETFHVGLSHWVIQD